MWQQSGEAQNECKSIYDGAREDAAQWLATKRPSVAVAGSAANGARELSEECTEGT